jgi:hypothetical protein
MLTSANHVCMFLSESTRFANLKLSEKAFPKGLKSPDSPNDKSSQLAFSEAGSHCCRRLLREGSTESRLSTQGH